MAGSRAALKYQSSVKPPHDAASRLALNDNTASTDDGRIQKEIDQDGQETQRNR